MWTRSFWEGWMTLGRNPLPYDNPLGSWTRYKWIFCAQDFRPRLCESLWWCSLCPAVLPPKRPSSLPPRFLPALLLCLMHPPTIHSTLATYLHLPHFYLGPCCVFCSGSYCPCVKKNTVEAGPGILRDFLLSASLVTVPWSRSSWDNGDGVASWLCWNVSTEPFWAHSCPFSFHSSDHHFQMGPRCHPHLCYVFLVSSLFSITDDSVLPPPLSSDHQDLLLSSHPQLSASLRGPDRRNQTGDSTSSQHTITTSLPVNLPSPYHDRWHTHHPIWSQSPHLDTGSQLLMPIQIHEFSRCLLSVASSVSPFYWIFPNIMPICYNISNLCLLCCYSISQSPLQ